MSASTSVGDGWARYRSVKEMGTGNFARVYQAWDGHERRAVAVKVVVLEAWKMAELCACSSAGKCRHQLAQAVANEANLLRYFQRQGGGDYGIVPCYDFFRSGPEVCLVMPLYGRSLYALLESQPFRGFPVEQLRCIAHDLLSALKFLHGCDYAHTDIKPENLVLLHDATAPDRRYGRLPLSPRVRLIDYGSAFWVHDSERPQLITTRHYRAPEVVLGLHWDTAADLWSAGCLLVELLTGDVVFQTHDDLEHLAMMQALLGQCLPRAMVRRAVDQQTAGPPDMFTADHRLRWPAAAHARSSVNAVQAVAPLGKLVPHDQRQLLELVAGLLRFDPAARWTAGRALHHHFFQVNLFE